ncbi:MAG TPA: CheR family methyltransferase [Stenotrophomonas sp.]|nr:CheR family methyltransferase [Stenotrophomonas sp.]
MATLERFPVVGLGASAGGVEALEGFFRSLPEKPGMAFVVVTHLSPAHPSQLPRILARFTDMPVHVATDGAVLQPNEIYVAPEGVVLGMAARKLRVNPLGPRREPKPIDVFFSELAKDAQELAVGIILSGGDGDGTLGLKAIQECAGLTLAQSDGRFGPSHPDMPDTAIASGFADFALSVEEMGPRVAAFARNAFLLDSIAEEASLGDQIDAEREVLAEIYGLLRAQVGHDFSGYKQKTFLRRVHRRMQVVGLLDISAYVDALRRDPQETANLFRDLLISVTSFFRDTDAFDSLAELVIPQLFEGRNAEDTIRVWVPGCATGEEVYSLAILLREHMAGLAVVPRVQLFATDIDERALAVARSARYPAAMLDNVSSERRERFFVADGESYIVAKDVRELCIFSPHSVIRDPPFSRIDLVSCRNLLIYFGHDIQAQVIPTFHYALKPDGFLFLGTAENLSQFDELFVAVEKRHRIFRRRPGSTPSMRLPLSLALPRGLVGPEAAHRRDHSAGSLRQAAEGQVLDRYAPPHVVTTSEGDVVYFSGRTGKYLETPAGTPTRHLLAMARRELRLDLRTVFREAVESGRSTQREGVVVPMEDGRVQLVTVVVEPVVERIGREPLFLVLFVDQGPMLSAEEAQDRSGGSESREAQSRHADRELRETRERLQSLIEEYETALEELKSSNEELVSVNEEMQSTNEELEASKEELQSVNEELHTVNMELHGKLDSLDRANSDLLNLFQATDVATVFLDADLAIRSFTPAVAAVLNIRGTDIGRPITDLSVKIGLPNLGDILRRVREEGANVELRATAESARNHYLVRVCPYLDNSRRSRGLVVTFLDVSSLMESESRQAMLIAELEHRTRNLLGVVQAIASRTLRGAPGLEDFGQRLSALGRAQSLLGGTLAGEVDLAEMSLTELSSLGVPLERVDLSGPKVALSFDMAQTFSLALHELTTNAIKYGCFKGSDGHLAVDWQLLPNEEGGQRLSLRWRESGGPPVVAPRRTGFGTQLITKALPHTLGANSHIDYEPTGVQCTIEVPFA